MGWNTTLFLLNDAQSQIDKDPAGWWDEVCKHQQDAVHAPQEFGFGSYGNGFWVVSNAHADDTKVIAVGGNYATILGTVHTGNGGHHRPDEVAKILKQLREGR